ncbi:MAG: hypothetical protein JNK05_26995 [Myxococcales bacterium]|nr:hypothetical protein [Myxococcales bacterium]
MSAEQLYAEGRIREAAEWLAPRVAQSRDPMLALQLYFAQLDLQQWSDAYQTLGLVKASPGMAPAAMKMLEDCGRAEYLLALRWSDPAQAATRGALRAPPPWLVATTKAHHAHVSRAGEAATKAAIDEREALRPKTRGTVTRRGQSEPFEDIVDMDAMTSASIPLAHDRTVLDAAFCELRRLRFLPAKSAFDVRWPAVEFETVFGARGTLRTVSLYSGTGLAGDAYTRIGRTTEFDYAGGFARAFGLRDYSITTARGVSMTGITGIEEIVFAI